MNPTPLVNPYAPFYIQNRLFSHYLKKIYTQVSPIIAKISLNCTFLALSLVESVTYTSFCFLTSWELLKPQEFNFPMSLSAHIPFTKSKMVFQCPSSYSSDFTSLWHLCYQLFLLFSLQNSKSPLRLLCHCLQKNCTFL